MITHESYSNCHQRIIERIMISEQRAIPFDEYMDICLYDANCGYYRNDAVRVGKEGDFYTSSNLGTLMGEMIVNDWFRNRAEMFPDHKGITLVEWGGGTGMLACHMLDHLQQRFPEAYERTQYISIETSAGHRRLQEQQLESHALRATWLTANQWFDQLSRRTGKNLQNVTVVFSNELLDAFPVKRAVLKQEGWHEIYVGWDEQKNCFHEVTFPLADDSRLLCYLQSKPIQWSIGQKVEVNFRAMDWMKEIAAHLPSSDSFVITIDYGDRDDRLYSEERLEGTLVCYHQHQANNDPYRLPGEQDITAHVNFSDIIQSGCEAGLERWEYMTQKQFLLNAGILDELQAHHAADPFHPTARRNRFIRQLLLGDTMAKTFKVLLQWRQ